VVGVVADAVVHKSTKVIDGYKVTIELDSGENMVIARTKNQIKSSGYDAVGDRLSILVSPKQTMIRGSTVSKEEAPAMIAKRAPHQLNQPADVASGAKPAEQQADVQPAITSAEESKTASAN
jgi:hypothetical protein